MVSALDECSRPSTCTVISLKKKWYWTSPTKDISAATSAWQLEFPSLHFLKICNQNLDSLMVCQFMWTRVAAWYWVYLDELFYIQGWFVAEAECVPALSHMKLFSCVVPASNYFTVYRRKRLNSALWWWKAPSSICALFINRSHLMSFSVLKIWYSRAGLWSGAFFYRAYVQNLLRYMIQPA